LKKKKVVQSEENAYQIPLKQSGFKDPELEKPKKNEESKPIFASVQLKGKGEFKDPEHEKQRKSLTNELPPEFGKVQLRRSDKNYDSLEKEIQRKSSGDYLVNFNVSLRKTNSPSDLKGGYDSSSSNSLNSLNSNSNSNNSSPKLKDVDSPSFAALKLRNVGEKPKTETKDSSESVPSYLSQRKSRVIEEPKTERKEENPEKPLFAAVNLKRVETKSEPRETKSESPVYSLETSSRRSRVWDSKAEEKIETKAFEPTSRSESNRRTFEEPKTEKKKKKKFLKNQYLLQFH